MPLFSVLTISTAMCLDKKLQWFVDHSCSTTAVEEINQQLIDHWTTSYKLAAIAAVTVAPVIVSLLSIFGGDLLTMSIKLGA